MRRRWTADEIARSLSEAAESGAARDRDRLRPLGQCASGCTDTGDR